MSEFPTEHVPAPATVEAARYAMTVGELREQLAAYPDGTPLVVQSDAEGNGFHHLHQLTWGWWWPEHREPVSSEVEDGEEPFEPDSDMLPVLFLEPS